MMKEPGTIRWRSQSNATRRGLGTVLECGVRTSPSHRAGALGHRRREAEQPFLIRNGCSCTPRVKTEPRSALIAQNPTSSADYRCPVCHLRAATLVEVSLSHEKSAGAYGAGPVRTYRVPAVIACSTHDEVAERGRQMVVLRFDHKWAVRHS